MRENTLELRCLEHILPNGCPGEVPEGGNVEFLSGWPEGDHLPQEAIDGWYTWAEEHAMCRVSVSVKVRVFEGTEDFHGEPAPEAKKRPGLV